VRNNIQEEFNEAYTQLTEAKSYAGISGENERGNK